MSLFPHRPLWPLAFAALAACGAGPEPPAAQADPLPRVEPAPVEPSDSAAAGAADDDPARQEVRSVRTSLRPADCTTISVDEEAGGSIQRCPGTAGHTLLALDGDARMSITVVDPSGREHPLDYWQVVTGGFSSLGEEAEWRVRGSGADAVPWRSSFRSSRTSIPTIPTASPPTGSSRR